MLCKNCGNELEQGSRFCTNCGTRIENSTELSEAPKEPEIVAEPCVQVQSNAQEAPEMPPAENAVTAAEDKTETQPATAVENTAEPANTAEIDATAEAFNEVPVQPSADEAKNGEEIDPPKVVWAKLTAKDTTASEKNNYFFRYLLLRGKRIVRNYKNFKNLSAKKKILYIVVPVVMALVLFGSGGATGSSDSKALEYLSSYNMLPGQMSAVYGKVSAAEVINYMFKNPSVEIDKDGNVTYITVSGNCRPTYGSSNYVYSASVTFYVNEKNGMVMIKDSTNDCRKLMEYMAVQMATN